MIVIANIAIQYIVNILQYCILQYKLLVLLCYCSMQIELLQQYIVFLLGKVSRTIQLQQYSISIVLLYTSAAGVLYSAVQFSVLQRTVAASKQQVSCWLQLPLLVLLEVLRSTVEVPLEVVQYSSTARANSVRTCSSQRCGCVSTLGSRGHTKNSSNKNK